MVLLLAPGILMAVMMAILLLAAARDYQRQQQRKAGQWAALKPARSICWRILFQLQHKSEHFQTASVHNLEDCLIQGLIATNEYQVLTNNGVFVHAMSWDTTPSNAVVIELFEGEYLITKSGGGDWREYWLAKTGRTK
jgi:hypothetical protein